MTTTMLAKTRPRRLILVLAGVALALPFHAARASVQPAAPQLPAGDSAIRITVEDQTGAVIPSARVSVTAASGIAVERLTDERGVAFFANVAPGRYTVRAEFAGFAPVELAGLRVRGRETRKEIRLPIAKVAAELTVGREPRESSTDPRGDAFATVLTRDQIEQLPDDPEELENALNQMAGPGAVMRVNGFRGGRMPPKSQIQEIRFRRNFFAADSHEPGFVSVDIRTRPGSDAFRASFDLGFRDEALNARNAFAPRKGEEQQRRFGVSLEGPLWKNRTSFALNTDGFDAFDSKTIVAALASGAFNDVVRRPSDRVNVNARIEHALTKTHVARAELQQGSTANRNLGVGDFDLPDRAFSRDVDSRLFRLSESGAIGKSMFNELRFQIRWEETVSTPVASSPAVQVLNAFSSGGAQISGARNVREIEIADNLDITRGKHTMRAGFLLEGGTYRSDETRNGNGVFTFSSLSAYGAGTPTTFSQRVGDALVEYSHYEFGWYFQDDIRARKDLTLSLGLRHEVQSHLDDWANFAPRAGFTWSPFRSGRTTFRGGAGLFHSWYDTDAYEQTLRVNGITQQDLVVRNPGYPDPYLGGAVTVLPSGRIEAAPGVNMPALFQASFGVERRLAQMTVLNVTYFETRGWSQLRGRNVNAPLGGLGRPDPEAGNITQIESTAESRSRNLGVNLNASSPQRRMFTFLNYTWGFARNEADGALSLPADNYNLDAEWGPSPLDVRHRFMGMLNLPVWKTLQFSSSFRATSAPPYNITTGFDDNGDTVSNDRPAQQTRNSARAKGHWDISGRLQYSFGFGTRPQQNGPMGTPVVRVVRAGDDSGPIGGGLMMGGARDKRVRVDVFLGVANIFNHVNYTNFSGVQTSPFFGQPTAAQPGRRMEVGSRVSF
jgi:hypothetical protein